MLIYSYPKLISNKSENVYKIKKNNKEKKYIYIQTYIHIHLPYKYISITLITEELFYK